jgi:ankyrin repeat protein
MDIHFYYVHFLNLSREVQFFYVFLVAFIIFIGWQVSTNPISRIEDGVLENNINLVRKCLEKGVEVDLQSSHRVTLLYLAVTRNHKEIAELLISHGADVNKGLNEEYGYNPLLAAAIDNHSELVKMLVDNGAKIGIHMAALQGNIDAVTTFLERQTFPINSNRNGGKRPISLAARGGYLKIVELLLDNGAILDFLHPSETPLYQAVDFNHLEVVDLLIDRGADPNHDCALHVATRCNYLEMVKRLIARGVDINYQDNNFKSTPLHISASRGLLDIAELLIINGAQVNVESKYDSRTPLHDAAENGCVEVAELLLANGAKINAHGGSAAGTPLLYAAQKGHLLMVELLICNGANINSGNLTTTPLDHARSNGHGEVIQLLNSYGAIAYGFLD